VLIPCSDHAALEAASLPPKLAARFPASLPPAPAIRTLTDKGAFASFCARLAIPHPATWVLERPEDVLRLPPTAFEHAFLKPRDSQEFQERFGLKAVRVSGPEDAYHVAGQLGAESPGLVLQRYVQGPVSNHYFVDGFVDRLGVVRALFARRRLRMSPPDFGNSSYMVSVAPDEVSPAIEDIRRLLTALRYRGVFSAEFKLDETDGTFRILEVNPRAWWYIRFAAQCGVNVCRMAWEDALEQPVTAAAPDYQRGRSCVHAYHDFFACRDLRRAGQLTLGAWAASWLGSRKSTFEWRDPVPAVVTVSRILGSAAARRVKRICGRAST
jgi:D-aspartate ligase